MDALIEEQFPFAREFGFALESLGDGAVVEARADNEHADLFHAIPGSLGTLAIVVSAKIRLVEELRENGVGMQILYLRIQIIIW